MEGRQGNAEWSIDSGKELAMGKGDKKMEGMLSNESGGSREKDW